MHTLTPHPNPVAEHCVTAMVSDLSDALEAAIGEIHSVNSETKVLALNARIEAARAGTYGAAFSVVAEEMQSLSDKTSLIAGQMASRTRDKTNGLMELIDGSVRGTRLSDLALVNIDLIDRNLYERTCDVRWWSSDASVVDALAEQQDSHIDGKPKVAAKRLGVILDAYTVYHDLVIADRRGSIVANGRPQRYRTVGDNISSATWFTEALAVRSADGYGFQSAVTSDLVDGAASLIYSCPVRAGGESSGQTIGVLGAIFDWQGLVGPIFDGLPVQAGERSTTETYIVEPGGRIVASNRGLSIGTQVPVPEFDKATSSDKGFYVANRHGKPICVGHAKSPGFETYRTGWISLVVQPLNR